MIERPSPKAYPSILNIKVCALSSGGPSGTAVAGLQAKYTQSKGTLGVKCRLKVHACYANESSSRRMTFRRATGQ